MGRSPSRLTAGLFGLLTWAGFAGEAVEMAQLKVGQKAKLFCEARILSGEVVNNAPDFITLKVEKDSWSEVPRGETILIFKSRIQQAVLE